MNWKDYSHLKRSHAFLSPSKYHWLNYTEEKLAQAYQNHKNIALGTRYHNIAAELISLSIRLPNTAASLNSFVNDAIGFRMEAEKILYYSPNCYGTADAISYHDGVLRIHDLKTGITPGALEQPMVYAAIFCLDYEVEPKEIHLRLYQNDEIVQATPTYSDIYEIMVRIVGLDKLLNDLE